MPVLVPGARGLTDSSWTHVSLHNASPASRENEVSAGGYARVTATWGTGARSLRVAGGLDFTHVGSDWGEVHAIGVWNGAGDTSRLMAYVSLDEPLVPVSGETLSLDTSVLRVTLNSDALTNAGTLALYNGDFTHVSGPAPEPHRTVLGLHTADPAEHETAPNEITEAGYQRRGVPPSAIGAFLELGEYPSLTLSNPDEIAFAAATQDWTQTPTWLAVWHGPGHGTLLAKFPIAVPAPTTGQAVRFAEGSISIDLAYGTALENEAPAPAEVSDEDLGSAADEATATDIAPSRRAVAAATDNSIVTLSNDGSSSLGIVRRDGRESGVQLPITYLLEQARISGNELIFTRENGTGFSVTLPTGTEVADGVVVSAVVANKEVTLTTSTGDTVTFDLSAFLLAADQRFTEALETKLAGIEPGAQVNVGVEYTQTEKSKLSGIATGAQVNQDITGLFNNARVSGNNLIFARESRPDLLVVLPAQQGGADGVVTGASFNATTKAVTLTTSTGATVALDLSSLAATSELSRVFNGAQIAGTQMVFTTFGSGGTSVNLPNFPDNVVGAEINSGVLTLNQFDGTTIDLTLPTGTEVADGVVVSATLNAALKVVTIRTSTGDTVSLNLSQMAALTDIENFARIGTVQVPANKLGNQRFTAADEAKLDGIAPGAQVNPDISDVLDGVRVSGNTLFFSEFGNPGELVAALNNFPDNVVGAEINGGVLTLNQFDGTNVALTLPTGTAVADGVVASATLDPATKIVTITTDQGDTVALNLSALALASELPSSGQLVPAGGTADQILGKASNADFDTAWVDAPEGGGTGGGGLSTVATENYVLGDGSDADKVRLDDTTLLRDWIGDYDTPILGSTSFSGTAAAAPGDYSWRNVYTGHVVASAGAHPNRRLQGTVALSVTRIVGAGAVAYRVVFTNGAEQLGIVKFADTGEDTQRFDIPSGTGNLILGRLQVQGAGEYSASTTYTNRRFHDGDGVLKDEIQAEIQAGTQHLADNAFSQVEFDGTTRDLTMTTEGGDEQVVNIADTPELLINAEINGGVLTLRAVDGSVINLTLPTGTGVADGVVTSATLNATTKRVAIGTSNGDTITLDLANMAALREVETYARVGNSARVPDARIDTAIARTSALPRTGQLVPAGGTGGQILGKTSATDYDTTWVDAGEGGAGAGGNTTHLVGQGNFDITSPGSWATEANSADIAIDDSDWFHVAINPGVLTGTYHRIRGDELRGKTAGTYGGAYSGPQIGNNTISIAVADTGGSAIVYYIGRTADNKLLIGNFNANRDPTPLVVYGENEADVNSFTGLRDTPNTPGSPGQSLIWNPAGDALVNADRGEGGVVTLEAGQSELSFGPVRQTTRGIVSDDTAALPNLTEFDLPFATGGRTLDEGLTVSTDNMSLRSANGGIYLVQVSLHGLASSDPSRQVDISANGVFRPEGELIIYRNTIEVGRVSFSYARYARWQTDGNGEIPVVANAGDRISFSVNLRRVDAVVGSVNWRGVTHLSRLHVTGNALPGAGIESETVDHIVTLTQAQYDALASPSGSTLYVISG